MICVMIADAPSPLLMAAIQFGGARLSLRVSCNLAVIWCITVSYSNLYENFVLGYSVLPFISSSVTTKLAHCLGIDAMQLRRLGTRAA
jgi:hypothetical protein